MCTHGLLFYSLRISPFSRNLSKLAYTVSFLTHLFCDNVCYAHEHVLMCQDMAFEGHGSCLGEGHLGQEGSGRGSPGLCLLFLPRTGGNFTLLCQQKTVSDLLWLFTRRPLACWINSSSTIHRITPACKGCPPSSTHGHTRIWALWRIQGDFLPWCVVI